MEIIELGRCIIPKPRHKECHDIHQVNRHVVVVEQRQDQREVARVENEDEASNFFCRRYVVEENRIVGVDVRVH